MATGAGKTTVMGMLIAWQTLNRLANPHDGRFADCFLIVTPGITIRDRLRVLLPNDPESIYRKLDLIPEQSRELLARARIVPPSRCPRTKPLGHPVGLECAIVQ
jgi:type III restriction enzyme